MDDDRRERRLLFAWTEREREIAGVCGEGVSDSERQWRCSQFDETTNTARRQLLPLEGAGRENGESRGNEAMNEDQRRPKKKKKK